jgi:hypothetical protein
MECISNTELDIIKRFRLLWNQHSEWTRMAVNSIVFMLPNQEQTVNRLLRNPGDFGMTFRVFYGERIGNGFADLLTEHLVLAADLVKAVMAGNTAEAEAINTRWYANAGEIAVFLAGINPCWSEAEWREMMFTHLQLVADEALTLINKEYQRNIDIYDVIEAQAMEMADTMSEGIIDQFFRRKCRKH